LKNISRSSPSRRVDTAHQDQFLAVAIQMVEQIRTASLTHLIELLRLYTGTKRVVRQVVTDDEFVAVKGLAQQIGLSVVHARVRLREVSITGTGDTYAVSVDWDDPRGKSFAIFMGDLEHAEEGAWAESENQTSQQLGELLQIPFCCALEYRRVQQGASWLKVWLEGVRAGMVFDPFANHLASYISNCNPAGDYLPCRITCQETAALGRAGLAAAECFGLTDLVAQIKKRQRTPLVVSGEDLLFLVGATPTDEHSTENPDYTLTPGSIVAHGPRSGEFSDLLTDVSRIRTDGDSLIFLRDLENPQSVLVRASRTSRARPSPSDNPQSADGIPKPLLLQFCDEGDAR
jgi:hypothetical protein